MQMYADFDVHQTIVNQIPPSLPRLRALLLRLKPVRPHLPVSRVDLVELPEVPSSVAADNLQKKHRIYKRLRLLLSVLSVNRAGRTVFLTCGEAVRP